MYNGFKLFSLTQEDEADAGSDVGAAAAATAGASPSAGAASSQLKPLATVAPSLLSSGKPVSLQEEAHCTGHGSLAYGLEWIPLQGLAGKLAQGGGGCNAAAVAASTLPHPRFPLSEGWALASCSFYDHLLKLWRPKQLL